VEYYVNTLNQALILIMFALSLNLLMGYAGQLSMAHAALGALGGYVAVYLAYYHGYGFLPGILLGAAAALVVGIIISIPAMRLAPEYMVLMTIALGSAIVAAIYAYTPLGGSRGFATGKPPVPMSLFGIDLVSPAQRLLVFAAIAAVLFAVCWRLGESPFGRVLKGLREDAVAVRALGKNTIRFNVIAFAVTSAMAGAAGATLAWDALIVAPTMYNFSINTTIITAVVLGGLGNPLGPVVGAVALSLFRPLFERFVHLDLGILHFIRWMLYGVLLVGVIRFRPQGLVPEGSSIRRWFANRHPTGLNSAGDTHKEGDRPKEPSFGADISGARDAVVSSSEHAKEAPIPGQNALEVRGLAKSFGGLRAVNDLGFDLPAHQITALIGPNGAGKTTVFNLVTGALPLEDGSVHLWGNDITGLTPDRVARLGMVRSFQDVRLIHRMTVLQNVMLAIPHQPGEDVLSLFFRPRQARRFEERAQETAREYLEFVGLEGKADVLVGNLGYGEQKLTSFARILATGAEVLLLDEPASGIDRAWLEGILEVILRLPQLGKTVLIVEHNLEVVRTLATKVYFMEQGRITASGTMEDLFGQERLSEVYFGRIH